MLAVASTHRSEGSTITMAIPFPGTAQLTNRLDALESRLPTIPARIVKLQRTLAAAYWDRTVATLDAVTGSAGSFLTTARNSGKTVTGQARAASRDVATAVRTNVNTVTGQAAAQGRQVVEAAEQETTTLVDRAIETVEDTRGSGRPYEQWTKAELVQRAKELHIVGPTRMSKADLIVALRAAS
jgi:hypothetical protein